MGGRIALGQLPPNIQHLLVGALGLLQPLRVAVENVASKMVTREWWRRVLPFEGFGEGFVRVSLRSDDRSVGTSSVCFLNRCRLHPLRLQPNDRPNPNSNQEHTANSWSM